MLNRARRRPDSRRNAGDSPSAVSGVAALQSTLGWIVEIDAEGRAVVDFEGNCAGPLNAHSVVRYVAADLIAAGPRPAVLLGFPGLDTSRPIVLGLVAERLVDAPAAHPHVAHVDGRRVEICAEHEISLRCGRAAITLQADGTIVIKGGELHSRASGRNRISGSTVAIN